MSGGPPQQDLFDYKPLLNKFHMQPCPDELLKKQRFAFIKGHPKMLGTPHKFARRGESGQWMSELLPHTAGVIDDASVIRSMVTSEFNHAPAELFMFTGSPRNGGAAMGSWITYGLGSENQDLPGFVVMISGGTDPTGGKAALEHRLLAQRVPGGAVPDRGRSGALRRQPQGDGPQRPPPLARRPPPAQRARIARVRRPRDADPDQPV